MPYTKVLVHYVWSTKYRTPLLSASIRNRLFLHIQAQAKDKKIFIDRINGWNDHVHCLIELQTEQTIAGVIKLIKGESSRWFNSGAEGEGARLEWQPGYFAVGVCESKLDIVRAYIDNQEKHHQKQNFEDEYAAFMKLYGFSEPRD
jgi:putative transposase